LGAWRDASHHAPNAPQKQLSPGVTAGAETGGEERRVERKALDALRAEHPAAPRTHLTSRAFRVDLLVGVGAAVEEGECCESLHGVVLQSRRSGFPFVVGVPYQRIFGQRKSKLVNIR
jgi:hypothetical protein